MRAEVARDERGGIERWARCLRVGVTGHRLARLANADLAALGEAVRGVLAGIGALLPGARSLHLVSSVAEGADSIAADAAVALGWRLEIVLPLPREDYAGDFPDAKARQAHEDRLARADAILELAADGDRATAYERAGRVVLAQSDLLVAIWDGEPARGRGGAAQIVAEAVLAGIPVVHVDPARPGEAALLWDGLVEHDFGQQTLETVPRGGLDSLPTLVRRLTERPVDPFGTAMIATLEGRAPRRRWQPALAYPLLLATMGVRRPRRGDLVAPGIEDEDRGDPLTTWFARADGCATAAGQLFRSAYVTNFSFAAFAVIASLAGLALPSGLKPVLAILELATIAGILAVTHFGRRGHWHRRWLDQRHLAERLRCLLVARRLGQLGLRRGRAAESDWVSWTMHAAARMTGLPTARMDAAHLADTRAAMVDLIAGQIAYLRLDVGRMHVLDHRLHRLGTVLFMATATVCIGMFAFEMLTHWTGSHAMEAIARPLATAATIASAVLPACGAAIYGIRMQGDFSGSAERNAVIATKLQALRGFVETDPLHFDLLWDRARWLGDLLTEDVAGWLHAYRARPLSLPG